jgi:hypothetical protein
MAINAFGTSMGQVRGLIPHIHKLTEIPEMTLRRWHAIIGEDPDWRPWHTHHGRHRRIFAPLEKISIVTFIRANFIDPGLIFTNSDFREIAVNAFLQSHAGSQKDPPPFQCSLGFFAPVTAIPSPSGFRRARFRGHESNPPRIRVSCPNLEPA